MFVLKFSKTFDNNIFTQYNIKPIVEDSFCVTHNSFCLADGVTRDNIHGEAVVYPETKKQVEEWISDYPNPSGAYKAAQICTNKFIQYLSEIQESDINAEKILEIAKKVNKDIWKINIGRKINYLDEDYYCCVAVGGIIIREKLYAFSIGDCHITLLDKDMKIKFTTIDDHKRFEKYLNETYCKKNKYDWNNNIDRIKVRKEFRNNPQKKYNGQEISFGVLSGEIEAEHYLNVYEIKLDEIKYICAYSDGCEPVFDSQEKIKEIIIDPKKLQNTGKERTLVIYEKIN